MPNKYWHKITLMPNEPEEANENTNIETGIFPREKWARKCLKKRYFRQSLISSKKIPQNLRNNSKVSGEFNNCSSLFDQASRKAVNIMIPQFQNVLTVERKIVKIEYNTKALARASWMSISFAAEMILVRAYIHTNITPCVLFTHFKRTNDHCRLASCKTERELNIINTAVLI